MMRVSLGLDLLTRMVHGTKPLWLEAGRLESAALGGKLQKITVDRPIFITGLARAGSTLLLEYIASHSGVVTHQYRDFPFIFTPYFSRLLTNILPSRMEKKERAHGDRVMVSPESPEAMEEMLWMAFTEHNEAFEDFYFSHIKKLLLVTHASRYAAKNNNLATRLPFLLKLFPDARIIVPVRDPVSHIASLMRQHQRFNEQAKHPRAIRHLKTLGHFEFGPTRSWRNDDEVMGWAMQWNHVYGTLASYIGKDNILFVPFESLCQNPEEWLEKVSRHAQLQHTNVAAFARDVTPADYYPSMLSETDTARIRLLTNDINAIFTKIML